MKATKVFVNGEVYTMNEALDWASAVAVSENKIVFVGSDEDVQEYIGDDTEVIDLEGRMMLPGFTDGHCHVLLGGIYSLGVVIDFTWDVDRILSETEKFVREHPDRKAYFGMGYSEWLWHEEKEPTAQMLDKVCPDKPIIRCV